MATLINFPALSEVNYPVTSVNGMTGAVTINIPVESVNGKTGAITLSASDVKALPNTYVAPVTSVNGKTGAVTGLYSANNPPPYPVTSVNGMTGAVTVNVPVTSVNGKTGDVVIETSSGSNIQKKEFSITENSQFNFYVTNQSLDIDASRIIGCIVYNSNKTVICNDVWIDLSIPSYGAICFRRGESGNEYYPTTMSKAVVYYI